MTTVPPTAWAPPTGPPVPPRPATTGRTGYGVGAAIFVGGSVIACIWLFALLLHVDPAGFPHVGVPGTRTVELQARDYTLYDDYPGGDLQKQRRPPVVRITGPDGVVGQYARPADETPESYLTIDPDTNTERSGHSFATIHPTVPGAYEVEVLSDAVNGETPGTEQVAIGEAIVGDHIDGYIAALLLGAATFFLGVGIIVATALRRRSTKG